MNDGSNTGNASVPMALLTGDTNGSAAVTSSDISQTGTQIGLPLTTSNFRSDVNVNGAINASDKSFVKSTSGTGLTLVDTDGDRVPDTRDGWPLHKQLSTPPVLEVRYAVIKLWTEGGVLGMNNLGDVVGATASGAMLWRVGQPRLSLGFLTQDESIERRSVAYAINDAGQVTGLSTFSWDPNVQGTYPNPPVYPVWCSNSNVHAFLWQADTGMMDLNDLSFGQPPNPNFPNPANKGNSEGYAINEAGIVVGISSSDVTTIVGDNGFCWRVATDNNHGVIFSGGTSPFDVGVVQSPEQNSAVTGINDRGDIIGAGSAGAFYKTNGQIKIIGGTVGSDVNNSGHVVLPGALSRARLWVDDDALDPSHSPSGTDERFLDLHAVPFENGYADTSDAAAINDRDQMVGTVRATWGGPLEAVIWQNGKIQKLRDLVATDALVREAVAINKHGMIAANAATAPDYNLGPVLLLPVEFVETTPLLTDEAGNEIAGSDRPKSIPEVNEMVEEPRAGQIPNVAYRILKVRVPAMMERQPVRWTMTPQFTPEGEAQPRFRGQWPQAHPDRFEASDGQTNYYQFNRESQEEGTTIMQMARRL